MKRTLRIPWDDIERMILLDLEDKYTFDEITKTKLHLMKQRLDGDGEIAEYPDFLEVNIQ